MQRKKTLLNFDGEYEFNKKNFDGEYSYYFYPNGIGF